jgi:protein TonB
MRSTTPTPEMPASITASPKPLAFQTKARSPLFATLVVVAFVHVLVILLLLSHFGWLGRADPEGDPDATTGQSGIVIPVTLETAQSTEETPSPEPESEPEPEPELKPESKPVPEPTPATEPEPEPQHETQLEPDPLSIPTRVEPRSAVKPDLTPVVKPISETPLAQNRAKNEALADSGKPSGSVQQSIDTPVLPLTPAHVDPNYLHRPNPVYPALSKRLREDGTVVLRVNLDAQGIVLDINIEKSSGFQRLDQAALEAVKQWRFVPAKRGHVAIPSSALIPIEFKQ